MYGKEPRYNEPPFNEQIWPVPSDFVKSRFHCITFLDVSLEFKTLALNTFLSKVVTRTPGLALSVLKRLRANSAQHKRKPFLIASFADAGLHHTAKQLHKYAQLLRFSINWLNACLRKVLTRHLERFLNLRLL